MKLTRKCKEKFFEWYENREGNTLTVIELELMSESVIQNALIIDFFDSVGVYIEISVTYGFNWSIDDFGGEDYNNRQQATIQAIKKANDIYNERN